MWTNHLVEKMISSLSITCTTLQEYNWNGLTVVGGSQFGSNSLLRIAVKHGLSEGRDTVPDHLLYWTVICLARYSSGNTTQCEYFGSSIEPSWVFHGSCAVKATQAICDKTVVGYCQGNFRRTPINQGSFQRLTRNQSHPWHEKFNRVSHSIVVLRTVRYTRLEKLCVDL